MGTVYRQDGRPRRYGSDLRRDRGGAPLHRERHAGGGGVMTNDLDKTVSESEREDYEVGYKKPPRNRQFCKGKSGNPAGRPKRTMNVQASLHKTLTEPVQVRINGKLKK